MKTKILAAVGISGLLMAGGVLSASAQTSGYDLFKTSLKKTHDMSSFTAHTQGTLQDNGKLVYQVDSLSQENLSTDAGSASLSINNGGKAAKLDFFNQNQQSVVKSSTDSKYYVKKGNEKWKNEKKNNQQEKLSPQKQKDFEAIFDALTKNYQDKITTSDLANGNTGLQLNLSKDEIPAVGQAVVSFALKNLDQTSQHVEKKEFGSLSLTDLTPQFPQLTNNINISSIELKGEVNPAQYLVAQEVTINVSGDDANGTNHNLVLHLTNNFDHINQTKVTSVDLTGKSVVNVKEQHHGHQE